MMFKHLYKTVYHQNMGPSKKLFFVVPFRFFVVGCCNSLLAIEWLLKEKMRQKNDIAHCKIHGVRCNYCEIHTHTWPRTHSHSLNAKSGKERKRFAIYAKIKVIKWFGVCLVHSEFVLSFSVCGSFFSLMFLHSVSVYARFFHYLFVLGVTSVCSAGSVRLPQWF